MDGTTGPWLYPSQGVLQGGITSPLLFVLYMAQVAAEVRRCVEQGRVHMDQPLQLDAWPTVQGSPGGPRTVHCGPLTLLLYADDLLIVAQNTRHRVLFYLFCGLSQSVAPDPVQPEKIAPIA